MREKRYCQEKIFDEEFIFIKLGENIDIITDNIENTLNKITNKILYYYNFEYGRKDNDSIWYGIIKDNSGRESYIRLIEKDYVDYIDNIGKNAIVLVDCSKEISKESFIEQSTQSLMKEYLSIDPSDKNTMRRKDIINMIEQLNKLKDENVIDNNILTNETVSYYKKVFNDFGYDCIVISNVGNHNPNIYFYIHKKNDNVKDLDLNEIIERFPIGIKPKIIDLDRNKEIKLSDINNFVENDFKFKIN